MLLKLQKYDLTIQYTKGKELYVADTLSRAYLNMPPTDNNVEDLEFVVHALVRNLPVSDSKLSQLQLATQQNEQMQNLHSYITSGWPTNANNIPLSLCSFWKLQHKLHIAKKLILLNNCIVIPTVMQRFLLAYIHQGHKGIEKCKAYARVCVYWPNMCWEGIGATWNKPKRPLPPSDDDDDDYFDDDLGNNTATDPQLPNEAPLPVEPPQVSERHSRYGRVIRPPVRYHND